MSVIFIEGIDGSGKTTLYNELRGLIPNPFCRRFPTGEIRSVLDNVKDLDAEAALWLFLADHTLGNKEIEAVLQEDPSKVVLTDRSWVSTLMYQERLLLDEVFSMAKEYIHQRFIKPDILLLLEVLPEVGLSRCSTRVGKAEELDNFENIKFLRGIAQNYSLIRDRHAPLIENTEIITIPTTSSSEAEVLELTIQALKGLGVI
jgi:dTMP kinase